MRNLLLVTALTGCSELDLDAYFVQMDVRTVQNETQAAAEFISVIETADISLLVALPHAEDTAVAQAVIDKYDAGLDVEVVTDIDQRNDPGIVLLAEAGVPLRLADGSVTYFDFNANDDVTWVSDQVVMSHAFVIADDRNIVNSTSIGGTDGGAQIVFQAASEDLADDLYLEHNQLMGGSDATALTAFSAPAKSQADIRWLYPTNSDAMYELWLGPQERVTKRVIDAIYTARRSVRVMSNEVANDGIARALQDKSSWGFDVELIVGPEFGSTLAQLEAQITNDAQDVRKFRFTDGPDLPTLILIDIEGRDGNADVLPRAYVLSHDLYSASRFYEDRQGRLLEVTTDQLIDGNLNVITDENYVRGSDPDSQLQPLVDLYQNHLDRAGAF